MSHVFEDTVLRDKPSQSTEDWGIESDNDIIPVESSDEDFEDSQNSAKPALETTLPKPTNHPRPIKLGQNGRVYTREIRLRLLIKSLFTQQVTPAETDRFLEQIRYIIISSGLLEERPLFSQWSIPTDLRRKRLLFDQTKPWTHLYIHQISSFGGPSAVAAIAYYLHLRCRTCTSQTERSVLTLVIFLVVIVYLFATSRRRLLRSLREKVLVYMDMVVQSSKFLDGDMVRVLKELQEIDFVSNGFAPNARPNYLANEVSDNKASPYWGRKLRSLMASSLHILEESYVAALKECIGMAAPENFSRFLEIYGLRDVMIEYNFVMHGMEKSVPDDSNMPQPSLSFTLNSPDFEHSGAGACYTPVSDLKKKLRLIHFIRRMLLCTLLSVESSNESLVDDLERWTAIMDHIKHINELNEQFSRIISREYAAEDESLDNPPVSQAVQDSRSKHHSSLVDVMARVKHLNARLDIINEMNPSTNELQMHIGAVKDEINDLTYKWSRFLEASTESSNFQDSLQSPSLARGDIPHNEPSSIALSPTLIATPDLEDSSAFSSVCINDLDSFASTERHPAYASSILEGESPMFVMPASSKLSRDERIKLARKNRAESHVYEQSHQTNLAQELTNVLLMRNQMSGYRGRRSEPN